MNSKFVIWIGSLIIMTMPSIIWGGSEQLPANDKGAVTYQQNVSSPAISSSSNKSVTPWWWTALVSIIAVFSGYYYAIRKSFFDEKQNAYQEIIRIVSKIAFDHEKGDEKDYSDAMSKLWLYAPRKTALVMDTAIGIIHKKPKSSEAMKALQEAVVFMRNDLQPGFAFWRKRLKPIEVNHLYTIFDEVAK